MPTNKTRLSIRAVVSALALVIAGPAAALGFGELRANVLLGQPLNVALPLLLSEGETLTSDCASAEVTSGDSRLPPGTVRVRVTQGRDANEAVLRISTTTAIDEPVVNIVLSAGCPTRITRTLVLLADPPLVNVAGAGEGAATPGPALPRTAPVTQAVAESTPGQAANVPAAPSRATRPATPSRAARAAAPRGEAVASDATAIAPTERPTPPSRPRPSAAASTPKPAPVAAARPRLQLDGGRVGGPVAAASAPERSPSPPPPASTAVEVLAAQAQASAARQDKAVAEAAATAAQQRLKDMEGEIARLRADAKAQTDALVELRKQIVANRSPEAGWLMPALLALVGLLGLTALWLAWKLRQQGAQREMQRDAWYERAPPPSSVQNSVAGSRDEDDEDFLADEERGNSPSRIPTTLPPLTSPAPPAKAAKRPPLSPPSMFDTRAGGLDSMISPPTMPAHTAVTLPVSQRIEDDSLVAMSVDEQIDLEQQADFFIALGHDESAIDLLMAHLRSTGGGTPLPFLKLLEIHGRRGDREAYERTRVRFNQRFNSVAPEWQADPKSGRTLEDYPLVVGRIQTAWPTPLDAMAELEALLFRRGAGSEMFELPAYQEVLFLYQLARDLHQQSQPDNSADVDVLLPIMTAPAPLADGAISLRPEFNAGQAMTLDFDLTPQAPSPGDKPMLELDLGGDEPAGSKSGTGGKRPG